MSDRTQGSVRTGSRSGDGAAPAGPGTTGAERASAAPPAPATGPQAVPSPGPQAAPSTGTQAIPTTGTQAIPTTGTQAIPTTGTQAIPTTGTRRAQGGKASGGKGQATAAPPAPAGPPPPGGPATGAGPATGVAAPAVGGAAKTPAAAPSVPAGGAAGTAPTVRPTGRPRNPARGRGPRRARLQLRHIDTWSALKISLVLSIALFFIWMVAVGILYGVLSGLGVFETLNQLFGQLSSASEAGAGEELITPGVVFGSAAVIGAINIVLLTALCTVATFIYNLCSDLVGGLEVTLSERD